MLRRRKTVVPRELGFLAADEWAALERLVDAQVRALGGQRDGATVVANGVTIALDNLARACRHLDRQEWPGEVERYFTVLAHDHSDSGVSDPVAARAALRVRLYPEEMFDDIRFEVVRRPWAGEVVEAVCLDRPDSIVAVNREMAEAIGLSDAELFELGLANVRAEGPPPERERLQLDDGVPLDVLLGDSFFTATWVHWIDELVLVGPYGALVVVPHRHQLAVHPIADLRGATIAPGRMLLFAHLGMADGVGPISPQLFWWRDGTVLHLPGGMQDDGVVSFAPPEPYLDLLEELPEG